MTKTFFALAGLQRSGATLLSSILNQNKNILVSPASALFRLMSMETAAFDAAENIDHRKDEGIARAIANTPHAFYADSEAEFVVDKNLNWQTPNGVSLLKTYIAEKPKIICPVRSIPDILASFNTIITSVKGNEGNSIDKQVQIETVPVGALADRRAEWLMRHDKDIPICLNGMKLALNPDLRDIFLFVEYEDLISDTKNQIERIYNFLEIDAFDHEYQNIVDPSGISEMSPITGIKDLHKVRPKIEKISRKTEDVLSEDTIRRYSGLEFWRKL